MTETQHWWWCLDHRAVEPDAGCAHAVRLGPYDTAEEAALAIEKAHARTEAWDEEDREWDEGPAGSSGPSSRSGGAGLDGEARQEAPSGQATEQGEAQ